MGTMHGDQQECSTAVHFSEADISEDPEATRYYSHAHWNSRPAAPFSSAVHNHANSTTNAVESMLVLQDQKWSFAKGMTYKKEISFLRNIILVARLDVEKEQIRCTQQESISGRMMEDYLHFMQDTRSSDLDAKVKDYLNEIFQRFNASQADLEGFRQRRKYFEGVLSNHEFQLDKLEREIYHEIDNELELKQTDTLGFAPPSQSSDRKRITGETDNKSRLLEELYSKMGYLQILLDRLDDFEYNLRQELDDRELQQAAGVSNLPSEHQFFEISHQERTNLRAAINEAHIDVKRLKQLCVEHEVEFKDVDFSDQLYNSDYQSASSLTTFNSAARLPLPQSPSSLIDKHFLTIERVEQWRKEPISPTHSGIEGTGVLEQTTSEFPHDVGRSLPSSPNGVQAPLSRSFSAGNELSLRQLGQLTTFDMTEAFCDPHATRNRPTRTFRRRATTC